MNGNSDVDFPRTKGKPCSKDPIEKLLREIIRLKSTQFYKNKITKLKYAS